MDGPGLLLLLLVSPALVRVSGEGFAPGPPALAPVPCNDKAVEKLSRLATTYINEDREEGYKFALNRIANVHLHAQGPAGNVYYLDLDVLETKCHIGSQKPWKRCNIRPFMERRISGSCNVTILHTPEGYSYLYSYECTLLPDPPEMLQQTCPTCPVLLPVESEEAAKAAKMALIAYQMQSTLAAGLAVKKVTRMSTQTLPREAIFVEFTVQECVDGPAGRGTCRGTDSPAETAGFCVGSLYGDLNTHAELHTSCEMFKIQNVDIFGSVQPQVQDLPSPTTVAPLDPTPPAPDPAASLPKPFHPKPLAPSSSESVEARVNRPHRRPPVALPSVSSSEEIGGPVARRPPVNFRYQRRDRKKRLVLSPSSKSHRPIFLSDFPVAPSAFRSCPGPARYITI